MALIRELMREPAINLIKLVIAYYVKRFNRGVKGGVLAKLLFLILYTSDDGRRLLESPRVRLPEEFRIYLKGPFIPIDRLLGEPNMYGIVRTGDSYYVKDLDKALEEARRALEERGLGDLADYAMRIIDTYGGLREGELINYTLEVLGIRNEAVKAMAFNMSLDAYIDAVRKLRKTLESRESIDEVDLYPELFR